MNIRGSRLRTILSRLRAEVSHAFAVNPPEEALTPAEIDLAERFARFIVNRDLAAPATAALEAGRPYNFLGSQFLTFLSPFIHLVFDRRDYDRFVRFLEKRQSVDGLLDALERAQNER